MASETRFFLMGFYGRRNFGDDLMALGLIEALQAKGVSSISVFCESARFLKDESIQPVSRSMSALLKAILTTDVLVQGGGTIFHDSYLGRARYRYWINLFVYAVIFNFARLVGTRVYVLGAGIGPIQHPVSRFLCRLALGRTRAVIVRDTPSLTEMQSLLPRKKSIAAHDLALLHTPPEAVSPGQKFRIGISICDLGSFMRDAPMRPWEAMVDSVHQLIPESERANYELCFLSLYTGNSSMSDAVLSRKVADDFAGFDITFIDYDENPQEFWTEIMACDMLIGTKFHTVVAGFIADRPTLAVSYNRKVSDFCAHAGFTDMEVMSLEQAATDDAWMSRLPSFLSGQHDKAHLARPENFRAEMDRAIDTFLELDSAS